MKGFALAALTFAAAGLCHASVNYTVQTAWDGGTLTAGTNIIDVDGAPGGVLAVDATAFSNNVVSGTPVTYVTIGFDTTNAGDNNSFDLTTLTLDIHIIDNNNPSDFIDYTTTIGGTYSTAGDGSSTYTAVLSWNPAGPQQLAAPSTYQFSIDATDNLDASNPAGSVGGTPIDLSSAPEPGTIALMGGGLALLGFVRRRSLKRQA
jgi:hypothetical protein